MRVIGILLAMFFYLVGIVVVSAIPMIIVAGIVDAKSWGKYGELFFIVACPTLIATLYAILLWRFDAFFIKMQKFRKASESEQKRLRKSGALDVLETSGAEINNVLVSDENIINAYAIGNGTVVFTTGILVNEGVSDDMLRGIAAHEAGHIAAGDTKTIRMFFAFSMVGFISEIIAVRLINTAAYLTRIRMPLINILAWGFNLAGWISHLIFRILVKISNLIMLGVSRKMEFAADKYAYDLNCGEGMKKFFHFIRKMEIEVMNNKNETLLEKMIPTFLKTTRNLLSTHPPTEERIKALEKLESA